MAQWEELAEKAATGVEIAPGNHISEIADLVDVGLQAEFSHDEIADIVQVSRGDSAEGFADRFAEQLESRLEERGYEISLEDVAAAGVDSGDSDPGPVAPELTQAEIDGAKYDDLKATYDGVKDKYLFRNVYVLSAKLELDIEAYNQGKPGANGKEVTGGDIAMDVLNLMRGNILDSMIEIALRDYFDKKYPGVSNDPDRVAVGENNGVEPSEAKSDSLVSDKHGVVRDDGYVKDVSAIENAGINVDSMRRANPEFAEFRGADMTAAPVERDGMKIWNTGNYDRMTAVIDGSTESVSVPSIRLVELHDNFYHVDPFGKVVYSDVENKSSELSFGDRIASLDVSARRGGAERFETLAANSNMTTDELKASISEKAEEKFVDKIESKIDAHYEYLNNAAIPEAKNELETYKDDLAALGEQKDVLTKEYAELQTKADNGAIGVDDDKRMTEIEAKLERNAEAADGAQATIDKIEARIEKLEGAVEKYDNVKAQLAVEDGPTEGRFVAAVEASSTAGRTENVYYADDDMEKKITDTAKEARSDIEEAVARDENKQDVVAGEDGRPDVASENAGNVDAQVDARDIETGAPDEKQEAQIDSQNIEDADSKVDAATIELKDIEVGIPEDRQETLFDRQDGLQDKAIADSKDSAVADEQQKVVVDASSGKVEQTGVNPNGVSYEGMSDLEYDELEKQFIALERSDFELLDIEDIELAGGKTGNDSTQETSAVEKQYIHYGHSDFDMSKFVEPSNHEGGGFFKPNGGFWASPVDAEAGWDRFVKSEEIDWKDLSKSFTFELSPDARVYTINSVDDIRQLPILSENGVETINLDFEKIANDYDAIQANAGSNRDVYQALYGWDVDALLILNPDIIVTSSSEPDHVTAPLETNDQEQPVLRETIADDDAIAVSEAEMQQQDAIDQSDPAPPETIQELVHGVQDKDSTDKGEGKDKERDEYDELREKLSEAYMEYLETDFFSLQADFYPELSDSERTMLAQTDVMIDALGDIYDKRVEDHMAIHPTPGMSFGDLIHEIASVKDGSEMQTIDAAINEIFSRTQDELLTEMFIVEIEPDLTRGLMEDLSFAVTDIDRMEVRFGDELYQITDVGLINALTDEPQDPEGMIERLVNFVSAEQGIELGSMVGAMLQDVDNNSSDTQIVLSFDRMFGGYGEVVSESISEMLDGIIYPDGREAFFANANENENADLVGNSERVEPHEYEFRDIATEQYNDLTQDEIPDISNIEFYDGDPMDVYDADLREAADALHDFGVDVAVAELYNYSDPVAVEDYEDYGEY